MFFVAKALIANSWIDSMLSFDEKFSRLASQVILLGVRFKLAAEQQHISFQAAKPIGILVEF